MPGPRPVAARKLASGELPCEADVTTGVVVAPPEPGLTGPAAVVVDEVVGVPAVVVMVVDGPEVVVVDDEVVVVDDEVVVVDGPEVVVVVGGGPHPS